jgi:hypothetical protein
MRKMLLMLPVAAAAAFATPALAQPYESGSTVPTSTMLGAGAVTGTLFGLSLSEAWWGSSFGKYALPATTGVAAASGAVAGIGTVALIHAATTPCHGFHALFGGFLTSSEGCENGHWVGYGPRRVIHRR